MKFQIGSFILDEQTRLLMSGEKQSKIRPKTLSLLLYLANRSGKIISKQELLDKVWDDVSVDDGVVFQSIREIRQLFDDANIIQNHPRKGYQFTADFVELNAEPETGLAPPRRFNLKTRLAGIAFACIGLLAYLMLLRTPQEIEYQQRILVLPIKNQVSYGEHEWVYLGGMEQLIANLQGLTPANYLYPGTQVPRLMHLSGAKRDYNYSHVEKLFALSGASIIVESELIGNASDYKLVYRLHDGKDVKEGVILDPSVQSGLKALSQTIAEFVDTDLTQSQSTPQQEFSDALFAKAMATYESDWQTSISFFQSYLVLNPESVIAHLYLSKLYLWQENLIEATEVIEKAKRLEIGFPHDKAHLKLIEARVAAKQKDYVVAHERFAEAREIASPLNRWFLKASIEEEQGLTFLQQQQADQAVETFREALAYYQITQSPIGLHSTRLHLSKALFESGQFDEAKAFFKAAEKGIRESELDFLYGMLDEYENHIRVLPDTGNNP